MFNGCSSLASLPGINKWNAYSIKYMKSIFDECFSLIVVPDKMK